MRLFARLGITVSAQPVFDQWWGGAGGMYETRLGQASSPHPQSFCGHARCWGIAGLRLRCARHSAGTLGGRQSRCPPPHSRTGHQRSRCLCCPHPWRLASRRFCATGASIAPGEPADLGDMASGRTRRADAGCAGRRMVHRPALRGATAPDVEPGARTTHMPANRRERLNCVHHSTADNGWPSPRSDRDKGEVS